MINLTNNFPPLPNIKIEFRDVADNSPALIWMAGKDGLCNWFNRGWLEFTGRTMEQELGNGWAEGVYAEDLQPCVDQYLQYFKKHESFLLEYRLRRSDGQYRWILDSGTPVFDPQGTFLGYNGVCFDIDERKESEYVNNEKINNLLKLEKERADELLLANTELAFQKNNILLLQQQLQATLSAIPDPIFELGLDGRYYECYAMQNELLAAPRETILGKLVSEVLPVDAASTVMSALLEANAMGMSRDKKFKLELPQGIHWFELTVVQKSNLSKDSPRFIVLSRDVTVSQNQAEKLQTRDLNFRFILENSPIAIRMASKATGLLVFVNKKYCELAELPEQDLIGTSREQFEVIEQDKSELSEAHLKKDVMQSKLVKLTNLNKTKWALASGSEMDFEGGPVYLGWFYEITSQIESEHALLTAMSEAEKANQAKSKFLAAASHDLRQPLTALSLYVDVLTKQNNGNDSGLGEKIQGCVSSLSELLDNLLNVSKLDAGAIVATKTTFKLADVLTSLVNIHAAEAALKGLSLHLRPTNLVAHTDETILQRILGNLIANAIRYTHKGGILIGCRHHNGKQWIEVWDSGVGFPSSMTKHIFEEFTQLGDNSRSVGSGLGLAIVSKSAKLLGLEMRVHSRPDRGSMFAIEIPQGEILLLETAPESKAEVGKWNIALVDDNPMVLEATSFALTAMGHQVITAKSELDLFKNLGYQEPDILISDYRLADNKTGLDLILKARTRFGEDLPAILITGDTDPKLIKLFSKHSIKVCYKPLKIDVLNSLISEVMLKG